MISTHSEALLSNPGIDGRGVLLLEAGKEGSTVRQMVAEELADVADGLTVAEVVLPKARPGAPGQLALW
jgi:hypothetical protein